MRISDWSSDVCSSDVLKMLEEIGRPEDVASAVDRAKDKNSGFRLMGFGHRVYKNYDPRAAIIREMTHKVLAELGVNDPMLEVALRLEEAALKDEDRKSTRLISSH